MFSKSQPFKFELSNGLQVLSEAKTTCEIASLFAC